MKVVRGCFVVIFMFAQSLAQGLTTSVNLGGSAVGFMSGHNEGTFDAVTFEKVTDASVSDVTSLIGVTNETAYSTVNVDTRTIMSPTFRSASFAGSYTARTTANAKVLGRIGGATNISPGRSARVAMLGDQVFWSHESTYMFDGQSYTDTLFGSLNSDGTIKWSKGVDQGNNENTANVYADSANNRFITATSLNNSAVGSPLGIYPAWMTFDKTTGAANSYSFNWTTGTSDYGTISHIVNGPTGSVYMQWSGSLSSVARSYVTKTNTAFTAVLRSASIDTVSNVGNVYAGLQNGFTVDATNGDCYVGGYINDNSSSPNTQSGRILKLDSNLGKVWSYKLTYTGVNQLELSSDSLKFLNGHLYVLARRYIGPGYRNILMKFTPAGVLTWAKEINPGSFSVSANSTTYFLREAGSESSSNLLIIAQYYGGSVQSHWSYIGEISQSGVHLVSTLLKHANFNNLEAGTRANVHGAALDGSGNIVLSLLLTDPQSGSPFTQNESQATFVKLRP